MNHLRGLQNMGNTCSFNAVLQLFLRCDAAVRIIRERADRSDPFFLFLEAYEDKTRPCDATVILAMFHARGLFLERAQHDAHEIFLFLLDVFFEKYGSIRDMFLVRTKTCFRPSEIRHEENTILTLPWSKSFDESVSLFETQSRVDGWFDGKKLSIDVETRVSGWPAYLVVHLSRYDARMNKITEPIDVPVAFRDYVFVGAIVHHGTLQYGHYTSIIRGENRIFVCDDDNVRCAEHEPLAKIVDQAYLLLYRKNNVDHL
ncbi:hypothetical protein EBZ80_12600 [bacterium]|nr:hypothetical protein [bacterium]